MAAFSPRFQVQSMEDIRRLEEKPLEDTIRVTSTYDIFVNSAKAFGDKIALRFLKTAVPGDETIAWSYNALLKRLHQTANLLNDLGVGKEDAVSILMPGCLEYHLALWGGSAAGISNPLNPLLSEAKLIELMIASKSKVLVVWGDDGDSGFWNKALRMREHVPGLTTILRVAPFDEDPDNAPVLPEGCLPFLESIAKQPDDHLVSKRVFRPDDVAAYFHTGGTTGSPKLARHSHGNQVFTAWASVNLQGITSTDITINGYPLFHVAGVLPGALTALSAGVESIIPTTSLLRNKEVVRNYWKLIDHYKVTSLSAVPTVLAAIAAVPLNGADISSITFCRTGAAPLPPELSERYQKMFGLQITESLGMTEMAGITSITPRGVAAPVGCVGYPLPYSRIRVVAIDSNGKPTGADLPAGEHGMVLVKSPNVFPGYISEEATRTTFTDDGWLITGDLGFLDEEGRLNLSGRAKDLIIRSGHNIDPRMIEDALDAHPAVDLCAAVGAPDSYAGELPVAFATLKAGETAMEEELLDWAAKHVDEAPARPKSVRILDAMPQTNVGKIFKPELRRMAAADAVLVKARELAGPLVGVIADMDKKGKILVTVTLPDDVRNEGAVQAELAKFPVPVLIGDAATT